MLIMKHPAKITPKMLTNKPIIAPNRSSIIIHSFKVLHRRLSRADGCFHSLQNFQSYDTQLAKTPFYVFPFSKSRVSTSCGEYLGLSMLA